MRDPSLSAGQGARHEYRFLAGTPALRSIPRYSETVYRVNRGWRGLQIRHFASLNARSKPPRTMIRLPGGLLNAFSSEEINREEAISSFDKADRFCLDRFNPEEKLLVIAVFTRFAAKLRTDRKLPCFFFFLLRSGACAHRIAIAKKIAEISLNPEDRCWCKTLSKSCFHH